jgi:hypothetical protein
LSRFTSPRILLPVTLGLAGLLVAESIVLGVQFIRTGKGVTAVKVVNSNASMISNSPTYANVTDMNVSMVVPSGEKAIFLIDFSAETYIATTSTIGQGYVRVLVDGVAAAPTEVIFDSDINTFSNNESQSHQFVAGPLGAGPHTFRVQWRASSSTSFFSITKPMMSILRVRA